MPGSARLEPAARYACEWGAPGGRMLIRSPDAELVAKARAIFGRWPRAAMAQDRTWDIDPIIPVTDGSHGRDRHWRVRASDGQDVVRFSTADHALAAVEAWAQDAFIETRPDAIPLHGALVTTGTSAVAILGAATTGKSTLAFALWERGWQIVSDDLFLVDPDTARAWPSPRRAHLRDTSEPLVSADRLHRLQATAAYGHHASTHYFHPDDVAGGKHASEPAPVTVTAIVFLGRASMDRDSHGIARVEPAHALLGILPFSLRLSHAGLGTAVARVGPLARSVPAYDLARGSLDDMTDRVSKVAEGSL